MPKFEKVQRVIFAEGEDENMLKAAIEFGRNKLDTPYNWSRKKS